MSAKKPCYDPLCPIHNPDVPREMHNSDIEQLESELAQARAANVDLQFQLAQAQAKYREVARLSHQFRNERDRLREALQLLHDEPSRSPG